MYPNHQSVLLRWRTTSQSPWLQQQRFISCLHYMPVADWLQAQFHSSSFILTRSSRLIEQPLPGRSLGAMAERKKMSKHIVTLKASTGGDTYHFHRDWVGSKCVMTMLELRTREEQSYNKPKMRERTKYTKLSHSKTFTLGWEIRGDFLVVTRKGTICVLYKKWERCKWMEREKGREKKHGDKKAWGSIRG